MDDVLISAVELHAQAAQLLVEKIAKARAAIPNELSEAKIEESLKHLITAQQYLQTGHMWLIRAVAVPD